jgi:hypothetical protein
MMKQGEFSLCVRRNAILRGAAFRIDFMPLFAYNWLAVIAVLEQSAT